MSQVGFWMSDASVPVADIAASIGFDFVVLDVEHGMYDLATLERFVPLLKSYGFEVLAKVLGPSREAIQQVLDFGCDGTVIPHIEDLDHAIKVTRFSKYPPLGQRSLAGGRTVRYGPITDEWMAAQDKNTICMPLIEEPGAVRDIEGILSLDTVDGIQIGPTDLSTGSGRGAYKQTEADLADINWCVDAANAAGKTWLYPAWTPKELEWALSRNAPRVLITMQYYALADAFRQAKDAFDVAAAGQRAR